eukprot:5118960-Prymnesium_polylepis.2
MALTESSQSSTNVLAGEQRQSGTAWPSWTRPFRPVTAFASDPPTSKRPVVVCGPSGVGKGTLLNKLLVREASNFPPQPDRHAALRVPPSACAPRHLCALASQKDYPDEFGFSVSHTTRQPRPGEQACRAHLSRAPRAVGGQAGWAGRRAAAC